MDLRKVTKTLDVVGEIDPWQSLADAIVIRAVRDFRNIGIMIHLLKRRIQVEDKLNESEIVFLSWRIYNYRRQLNYIREFFRSDYFTDICGLDGVVLLRKLECEIA